jgi:hypothetical protein
MLYYTLTMCSAYWNLTAVVKCPDCKKAAIWNLQTHFMGDFGSCVHEYKLGEEVIELKGVTVLLDGGIEDFIGNCPLCGALYDVGGEIVDGRIKRVFILKRVEFIATSRP